VIADTWVWALVGIVVFLVLGLGAALLLGLLAAPWGAMRRRAPERDVVAGVEVPDEVPPRLDDDA
jgi:hypothetical protein